MRHLTNHSNCQAFFFLKFWVFPTFLESRFFLKAKLNGEIYFFWMFFFSDDASDSVLNKITETLENGSQPHTGGTPLF